MSIKVFEYMVDDNAIDFLEKEDITFVSELISGTPTGSRKERRFLFDIVSNSRNRLGFFFFFFFLFFFFFFFSSSSCSSSLNNPLFFSFLSFPFLSFPFLSFSFLFFSFLFLQCGC